MLYDAQLSDINKTAFRMPLDLCLDPCTEGDS
jgi:hypothetical protein